MRTVKILRVHNEKLIVISYFVIYQLHNLDEKAQHL